MPLQPAVTTPGRVMCCRQRPRVSTTKVTYGTSSKPAGTFSLRTPPCTHLAVSGARWFKDKKDEQAHGLGFVMQLWAAPVDRIAIENPISILSSRWRKPDQIIQPWQFGHGEVKATCLWLKNLPRLVPSDIVEGRDPRVHFVPPGEDRWKERSRTLDGIAQAMATQWEGPFDAMKGRRRQGIVDRSNQIEATLHE